MAIRYVTYHGHSTSVTLRYSTYSVLILNLLLDFLFVHRKCISIENVCFLCHISEIRSFVKLSRSPVTESCVEYVELSPHLPVWPAAQYFQDSQSKSLLSRKCVMERPTPWGDLLAIYWIYHTFILRGLAALYPGVYAFYSGNYKMRSAKVRNRATYKVRNKMRT